ncbi:Purine permease 3 [Dichanthelium oligosanthes]|uniref:Probable purine permease n=1 Tax=Dichanthelium oligosanthes TaxID=888268 RepID=A0A1E5UPG4_9POAL|nr:Purine permease 3 [Dichanthelium oligosanthes]
MEAISTSNAPTPPRHRLSPLVILSACLVLLGAVGSLLTRVYFVHGGQRLWLSTMIQVSGWPLLLPPLCASLLLRSRRRDGGGCVADADHLLPPRFTGAVAVLGVFFALSCFAYSLGSQALPLSTSCLLQATQLTFNAVSAFLFAGLRFTPFSVNAVVLLTVGPAVLGVGPSSYKVAGEGSSAAYWTGFLECMASAALMGLVLPLVEVVMSRYGRRSGPAAGAASAPPSYATVMQIQLVMGAAGTVLCLAGMAITKDFQAMPREASTFGLGETSYYLVLVCGAVSWQLFNLGTMGLIICSSSLLAGIMIALVLPLSEVLAVIFLHEKFDGVKGIALVLSLWGFVSYLYGGSTQEKMEASEKHVAIGSEDPEYSVCCPLMATC